MIWHIIQNNVMKRDRIYFEVQFISSLEVCTYNIQNVKETLSAHSCIQEKYDDIDHMFSIIYFWIRSSLNSLCWMHPSCSLISTKLPLDQSIHEQGVKSSFVPVFLKLTMTTFCDYENNSYSISFINSQTLKMETTCCNLYNWLFSFTVRLYKSWLQL